MSDIDVFNRTENKIVQERDKAIENYNSTAVSSQAIENYGEGLVIRLNQIFQAVTSLTSPADQLSLLASEIEKFRDIVNSDVETSRNKRIYLQARVQSLNECVGLVKDVKNEVEQDALKKEQENLGNKEAVKRVSEKMSTGEYDPNASRNTGTRPERLSHVRRAQTLGNLGSVRSPE